MKVGDKAKGFKFEDGTNDISYWEFMDNYIGEIGVITMIKRDCVNIRFSYNEFIYPKQLVKIFDEPKDEHYNNENGSLYQFANNHNLNAWEFDIIKRIVRCRKKGQFESDLEKTKRVIDLYLKEFKNTDK